MRTDVPFQPYSSAYIKTIFGLSSLLAALSNPPNPTDTASNASALIKSRLSIMPIPLNN